MNVIVINNLTRYKNFDYLEEVLNYALEVNLIDNAHVSIILVGEKTIKRLNKEYRGIDSVTDVLSFAFEENNTLVYNEFRLLGDIYICVPRMKKQAKKYKHSEKRELSFLGVHGLLHLLGFDHLKKEDEEKMLGLQEMILNGKNITREN